MHGNRREFFSFLAASTAALAPHVRARAQELAGSQGLKGLTSAKQALQVTDFEPIARQRLSPAHWGFLSTGADDDLTLAANIQAFRRIGLRPRVLVDVSKVDTRVEVFGETWQTPLFLCPVGSQLAFHADGELATARAARAKGHALLLSNSTGHSVEAVARALGKPPWQQIFLDIKWEDTEKLVRRIEDAGCPVVVWTVDLIGGRKRASQDRFVRQDAGDCSTCHKQGPGSPINRPMWTGLDRRYNPLDSTWAALERLKKLTRMKVVLKGIDTAENAELAAKNGVDGLVVSNHGGRATETLRATIDCLPEVVSAVGPRVPVFLDGGIRRGGDIYKALAAGARGVGIGRPYIWGLSAFGQEGVEQVLGILTEELTLTMRQMGTPSIRDITPARVSRLP
jgi:isopentenyl diphosphate isomerase/L-lactate dehydrogenase-like FMN-dependent dehydrogenase